MRALLAWVGMLITESVCSSPKGMQREELRRLKDAYSPKGIFIQRYLEEDSLVGKLVAGRVRAEKAVEVTQSRSVGSSVEKEPLDLSTPNRQKRKAERDEAEEKRKCAEKTSNSAEIDSEPADSDKLDERVMEKIKKNLSIWNSSRLTERHRKAIKYGYVPVYNSEWIRNKGYMEVGDREHIRLIQKYARHCMAVFRTAPTKNKACFIICSRTTTMYTKLADCEAIAMNPECFQWTRKYDDYYPGMSKDMKKCMAEHGPMHIDKSKPNLSQKELEERRETMGDVCTRNTIDSPHAIDKKSIIVKSNRQAILVTAAAVRMIMALPEVWKDLFCIEEEYIKDTLGEEIGSEYGTVIRVLHWIGEKYTAYVEHSELDTMYHALSCFFDPLLARADLSPAQKAVQIYTILYCSLARFYGRAEIFRKKLDTEKKKDKDRIEYTSVEGKHIIRNQVYLKWSARVRIETDRELSENTHEAEEVINCWNISPDVQMHYHVHYVNNSTQQYRRLCMPVGPDGRGIHTIHQIVRYIERVHGIREENCVHPYIRDRSTECWSYLEEKDRNQMLQEFMLYYDIVFYYIKEGLRNNYFTFAEFESFRQPEGEVVRIPLFLSPLMRSIGESGPFEKKNSAEHTLVEDMQFKDRRPDVYAYRDKYRAYLYYPVHHYYSNLYIRVANADIRTLDCYIMDMQTVREGNSTVVMWHVKVPQSMDEYTHCALSVEFWTTPGSYDSFIRAVYCLEFRPDTILCGFGVQNDTEENSWASSSQNVFGGPEWIVISPLNIEDRKRNEDAIESKLSDLNAELEEVKKKEKEEGLSNEEKEKLKRRKGCINTLKCIERKKQKKMQEEIPEEKTPIPSSFSSNRHSFIVIKCSNTETKSSLGLWNELFDMFMSRYNNTLI